MSASRLAAYLGDDGRWQSHGIPKYVRLVNAVLRMVEEGHWKPGDQIPSEAEMARTLDASLGTIQKAMNRLADVGVVVREHGRGTFVTGGRAPERDIWYFRFLDDDGETLLPIYSRIVDLGREGGDGPWRRFLGEGQDYVRILRLMSVNHEFDIVSEVYVSTRRFGAILEIPVKNLHGVVVRNLLRERFGVPTVRVVQKIRISAFPAAVCSRLGTARRAPGLIWEMFAYTHRNAPLSYQRAFVPPNRRALEIGEIPTPRHLSLGALSAGPALLVDEERAPPMPSATRAGRGDD